MVLNWYFKARQIMFHDHVFAIRMLPTLSKASGFSDIHRQSVPQTDRDCE